MENIKIKRAGRKKLNIDEELLKEEIEKYKNGQKSAIQTYMTLGIGKTSFYRLLSRMEVQR